MASSAAKEANSGKLENEVLAAQDQDQQGGHLDGDEGGRVAQDMAGQLGDQGGVAVLEGADAEAGGQEGDADEQERHDGGHADQGGAGVAGLGLLERRHPVGDCLHSGEGGHPGREGVQHQEQRHRD
jgi:hypothetical protein